jgi:two-component system response regulator AtoC/two-component system response regulator HupR/HoxA
LPELAAKLELFPIRLPPLRERREDILPLAKHFLSKYGRRNARAATSLSDEAATLLSGYDFPGNARELENVLERAAVLARGDTIRAEHLAFGPRDARAPKPEQAPAAHSAEPAPPSDLATRLEDIERRELIAALERSGGNKAEVARSLGIQRTTLYYRLKRLGIEA